MDRISSKFLLNVAYNGTRFFGIQRQTPITTDLIASNYDNTIQMAVELALCRLKAPSVPWPTTGICSRTDAGVHANQNFIITGLNHPAYPKRDYYEEEIADTVNAYMRENLHDIVVKSVHRISRNYLSMRPVIFREYKYYFYLRERGSVIRNPLPSSQLDTYAPFNVFTLANFSFDRMKSALSLMKGMHDFKSFEAPRAQAGLLGYERRDSIRDVTVCDVEPINMMTNSFSDNDNLKVHVVTIRSSGFLYRQVRRMVGIAIMAALDEISLETVQGMLEYAHHWQWSDRYLTAPAEGLFLNRLCFKGLEEID